MNQFPCREAPQGDQVHCVKLYTTLPTTPEHSHEFTVLHSFSIRNLRSLENLKIFPFPNVDAEEDLL